MVFVEISMLLPFKKTHSWAIKKDYP